MRGGGGDIGGTDLWSSRRTEDARARIECGSDWKIMADVNDSAREGDAIGAVVFLQKTNVVSDLVNMDVIALAGVRLSKGVHDGKERRKTIESSLLKT